MVVLTPSAVAEAKRLRDKDGRPDLALRLKVKGGGCTGFLYDLDFDTQVVEKDNIFEYDGLRVAVDPKSYVYLRGMELDFSGGLNGKGFEFKNPNANSSCSCGQSFSV
ncbi:MAG: HesB/IscA family protein [bacterium]